MHIFVGTVLADRANELAGRRMGHQLSVGWADAFSKGVTRKRRSSIVSPLSRQSRRHYYSSLADAPLLTRLVFLKSSRWCQQQPTILLVTS